MHADSVFEAKSGKILLILKSVLNIRNQFCARRFDPKWCELCVFGAKTQQKTDFCACKNAGVFLMPAHSHIHTPELVPRAAFGSSVCAVLGGRGRVQRRCHAHGGAHAGDAKPTPFICDCGQVEICTGHESSGFSARHTSTLGSCTMFSGGRRRSAMLPAGGTT